MKARWDDAGAEGHLVEYIGTLGFGACLTILAVAWVLDRPALFLQGAAGELGPRDNYVGETEVLSLPEGFNLDGLGTLYALLATGVGRRGLAGLSPDWPAASTAEIQQALRWNPVWPNGCTKAWPTASPSRKPRANLRWCWYRVRSAPPWRDW